MRRVTGGRLAANRWAILVVAALGMGPVSGVGWGQVRLGGELGWQGVAVVGVVNPLVVTVDNAASTVLSATLRVEQRVGSGWRGHVVQRLEVPLLVAPGARMRVVFPWPVEVGSEPATVVLESDGGPLARVELPLRPMLEKPVAVVGTLTQSTPGPVVALAADDLPDEPLLLSPFAAVEVAPGVVLSAAARDALRAWVAFGGGTVSGVPVPAVAGTVRDSDLREALRDHRPRPAPVGLLLGWTAVYLIAVGYALAPLSRRSAPWGMAVVVAVSVGFGLVYPVWVGSPHTTTIVQYALSASNVVRFSYDTLTITQHRAGTLEIPGWWVERVSPGSERVSRQILWVWGGEGPRTVVRIDPGQTLILERYGSAWFGEGKEVAVGPGTPRARAERGFAPLLTAVESVLREGDRLIVDSAADRSGGVAWSVYRLRWVRSG
ncbi:MAG: hypothetical protein BIP78_0888 [Candidatus Bipolaricaulis sibiricus]|uniref:Uncharacterized protein n=1 Tax=Bipolaricaulis sibiricus TaxID=2501609 RepID=A0A410FUI2_BIPS1|nr:MAG: hypothetical protein BIP78_0888 [Candidatus Bipolaricaulis sibiricus]